LEIELELVINSVETEQTWAPYQKHWSWCRNTNLCTCMASRCGLKWLFSYI